MGATIDISKAWLTRQHGDITVVYSWVNGERALILIPTYRKNASWYIVCDSAAWKYDDPQYLARQCKIAADVLGVEPSVMQWVKIATIINEGLPDLIRMPSEPEEKGEIIGLAKIAVDGKEIGTSELREEKVRGVEYEG